MKFVRKNMADMKTKKTKTPISRSIEPDPKPIPPKITSADIINSLKDLNNTTENLAIIMNNVLEEIRTTNRLNADILKKLNNPAPVQYPINKQATTIQLPPPPSLPEVPNTGAPFHPQGSYTGDSLPQRPTITSTVTSRTNIPGTVPPEEAGRILRQKLEERRKAQQPQQQQIPSGKSAGGTIARPAKPMDGVIQVGDISDSVRIDWLGENHPTG